MNANPSVDPARCPLCGAVNACAMEVERATGVKASACWCTQVDFGAALLGSVPEPAKGLACICASCAAAQANDMAATPKAATP